MQNFGYIKSVFNEMLIEALISKDKKKKQIYSNFVNAIKTNKILNKQFQVYDLLENKFETNDGKRSEFIKETLSLLNDIKREDIFKENLKLVTPLYQHGYELPNLDYNHKALDETIAKLIFTKKSGKTINSIVENISLISEHIKDNIAPLVVEGAGVPDSLLMNTMVNKFNEKYSELSESDSKVIKSLISTNIVDREIVFNDLIRECLELTNSQIPNSTSDIKESLLNVKEKLLEYKFSNENYIQLTSKLIELKNDLS